LLVRLGVFTTTSGSRSYPGHPQFLATIVIFYNTVTTIMVRGGVAWCSPLVVEPSRLVLRHVQSIAEVVGNVAILSHRVLHLVENRSRDPQKSPNSWQVPSDNRPVKSVYIKTHPGGPRSPEAGYLTLSGANAAASASAQGDNVKVTDIIGDGFNLLRDASWRHVPCVTTYKNSVLGMSETRKSSELFESDLPQVARRYVEPSLARLDLLIASIFAALRTLSRRKTSILR
jgi:hypothetical protein